MSCSCGARIRQGDMLPHNSCCYKKLCDFYALKQANKSEETSAKAKQENVLFTNQKLYIKLNLSCSSVAILVLNSVISNFKITIT